MKIRFYKYSETDYTVEIKKWHGWQPVYLYGGTFSICEHFTSKEKALQDIRNDMYLNPYGVRILEYPTIIVHKHPMP